MAGPKRIRVDLEMPLANSEIKRLEKSVQFAETYMQNASRSLEKYQYERARSQFKKAQSEISYIKSLIET